MARRDTQEEAAHHTDEESHIPDSTGVTNAGGLALSLISTRQLRTQAISMETGFYEYCS